MARLFKIRGSDDWHGKIRLGPYRQKRARFCADKDTSGRWHALLQAAVDRHGAGEPIKPETERDLPRRLLESFGLVSQLAAKRRGTYTENVQDYIDELRLGGRDEKYIGNVRASLTAIGNACQWRRVQDVNRDALVKYLERRKDEGSALRTIKNVRATAVAFCLWALGANRLASNPLAKLPHIDDTVDRRRQRRALTSDEVKRLLRVAGLRELCYRVALGTGLRLGELRRLQWRDVRIDNTIRPRLELRPEATKSRRGDVLPLSSGLVSRLAAARPPAVPPGAPVFPTVPVFETFADDCKRAGIECYDGDVLVVGFHSLRVTFCSELERAGVSPRTIMELARHRDYRLTATTYTDPRVLDTAGAVAKLPGYDTPPERDAQTARREGTNDAPAVAVGAPDQIRDQTAVAGVHAGARTGSAARAAEGAKTLGIAAIKREKLERQELSDLDSSPTRGDQRVLSKERTRFRLHPRRIAAFSHRRPNPLPAKVYGESRAARRALGSEVTRRGFERNPIGCARQPARRVSNSLALSLTSPIS